MQCCLVEIQIGTKIGIILNWVLNKKTIEIA